LKEAITFQIEIIPQAYPNYPKKIITNTSGSVYLKFHTKITFSEGTILNNYSGDWIYNNNYYVSLEELIDKLPIPLQEVIFFNLEIFRKI
jgi:hypothetical protein